MNMRDDTTIEDPLDELELYVLDLLDDDEHEQVEARIAGSDELRRRVRELRGTLGSLAFTLEPMEPPAGLRERIQEQARAESGPLRLVPAAEEHAEEPTSLFNSMPWVWAAAAVFALALVGALVFAADDGLGELEVYPVATTDASAGAVGQVRVRQGAQQATLDLTGLQSPPPGQVYQVWMIEAEGAPIPNVTFVPDANGEAHLIVRGNLNDAQIIAVTTEPPGGSLAPTTDPLLVSELGPPGTV
ncbi:hypothetical protein BH23CHL1_BH23CHL1_23560 [soil metagenome]